MQRVGCAPDQLSSGGNFQFLAPRGEIIDAKIVNHAIPGYSVDCGYLISISALDEQWRPLPNVVPVEEFIKCGPTAKDDGQPEFHPGQAISREDASPMDLGGADGTIGNCLLTAGRGPDRKSKIAIFSESLVRHGVKKELLASGWALDLVGLKATFTQFKMERLANSTAKNDPTCLIIGKSGEVAGGEVNRYPFAQTGTPIPVSTPGSVPAAQGAQGASGSSGANGAPQAGAAAIPVSSTDADDQILTIASQVMATIAKADGVAGKTLTVRRLLGRVPMALTSVDPTFHKAVQAKTKDPEFIADMASMSGWVMSGDSITFPPIPAIAA